VLERAGSRVGTPPRLVPRVRQVPDLSALRGLTDKFERRADDRALQRRVTRNAEVMSHHERDEDGARRETCGRDVAGDRDRDGREMSSFECALDQRHGLVADRSSRGEQYDVGRLALDCRREFFGEDSFEAHRIHVVADERKQIRRQGADDAVPGEVA